MEMGYTGDAKRAYQKEWVAQRRKEGIRYLGGHCVVCKTTNNLNVDHVNPKTKISHNIWSWSESRRKKELDKCQLLCETHHKEKTRKNKEYNPDTLDEKTVKKVKELLAEGKLSQRAIAKTLGIAQGTVSRIKTGKKY